ncbi:cupin domain-containing protein [Alloacidobacterium dinghuense]|uniref:Cupin domain-containing protein n=1 Tax=Alloacidobacterium dinghuense TaxID=2763107 RepID=A0A7G8BK67_9BACT|nr:cupin domain-containing protein [Alloacidobacterium dinghuense]QNI32937.1 cupin domain-containing protein [Alloacidobacterium dinghuense]
MSEIEVCHQATVKMSDPEPGLKRQVLAYNANLMLVRHLMEKGWQGVLHSHSHDQLVYVIRGRLRFTGGASSFEAAAGDSFVVPGNIGHQAAALEESEVLDVFNPYREEYAPVHGLE